MAQPHELGVPLESLSRALLLCLCLTPVALWPQAAMADIASDSAGDEDDDSDDDDKGCATVVAPVSGLSLLLGVGLVMVGRRQDP